MNHTNVLQARLEALFGQVLGLQPEEVHRIGSFSAMGISSLNTVRVLEAVNTAFDLSLPTSILFECHDLPQLVRYIEAQGVDPARGLSAPAPGEPAVAQGGAQALPRGPAGSGTEAALAALFQEVLGLQAQEIRHAGSFHAMGLNSLNTVRVLEAVNTAFDLSLPTSILFECHDLPSLARHVEAVLPAQPLPTAPASGMAAPESPAPAPAPASSAPQVARAAVPDECIAIVGLASRCAGADDQYQFWDLVRSGRDCIRERGGNAWQSHFKRHAGDAPVPAFGGFMQGIDLFDPLFFKISPKEAEAMDPCQRILLEECYAALEDAGQNPAGLSDAKVALFVGAMGNQYPSGNSHYSLLGIESSILAARLAYFLNLKGPALSVNTACSSSLVALDLAAEKLRNHEVDLALAAGITIYTNPDSYLMMSHAGMLAPDGRCKPFDDSANGIVVGDGVGVVVIKRLQDALRDGDQVYAILEGIAINQDGKTSGLTVPSFLSQSALEQHVYRKYGIDPEGIQYLEAHGTGTRLGDPIEIHAATHAFRQFTDKKQFCAVGALKANIGHTTAAAGVLGMIKALLAMRHQWLPPSINCRQVNRHIDFADSPFYVNHQLQPWQPPAGQVRRAAVSSFGFSGTNAHLVLKEWDGAPKAGHRPAGRLQCVPLSAHSEIGLRKKAARLLAFLEQGSRAGLAAPAPMVRELLSSLAQAVSVPVEDIQPESEFGELGLDRYTLAAWHARLAIRFPQLPKPGLQDSVQSLCVGLDTLDLEQVAYTLQVGREPMPRRCVFLVQDLGALRQQLQAYVTEGLMPAITGSNECSLLARRWLDGETPDWLSLYAQGRPQKISLPGHVFERQSYWLPNAPAPDATLPGEAQEAAAEAATEVDQQLLALTRHLSGEELLSVLRRVLHAEAA